MTTSRFTDIKLITENRAAWLAKRQLIAQAERSLDLAYFIVDDDATTAKLLLGLVTAAGRGVRVRLMVDYFMTYPHADFLRTLECVPNIEVRRYRAPEPRWLGALGEAGVDPTGFIAGLTKPDAGLLKATLKGNTVIPPGSLAAIEELKVEAGESRLAFALRVLHALRGTAPTLSLGSLGNVGTTVDRMVEIVRGLDQFLHRTHHKLLMADKRCFIMGGRNLADEYQHDAPPGKSAFRDTDVQACDNLGAASQHVTAFETLWDSSVALTEPDPLDRRAAQPLESLQSLAAVCVDMAPEATLATIVALPDMDGSIVNNLPSDTGDASITTEYIRRIDELRTPGAVIDIVSAYVCLGDAAMGSETLSALFQSLLAAASAGVTVNIHTNSVDTTDLKAVNKAAYRKLAELIDGGVNVFELDNEQGSLHTKAAAIGDEYLMIGSYNMDPRSELYDTNNLIVFRDTEGLATAAFRKARIASLRWRPLTAARSRQLASADLKEIALTAAAQRLL